jgi:hypothetical protein
MLHAPRQLAVLAVLSLGACKGDGKAPASTGAPGAPASAVVAAAGARRDPCALMTSAEIEAAIGTPVVKATGYGGIECRWTIKPLPAHPNKVDPWVAISLHNDMAMHEVEVAPGTNGVAAINGLGERAFRTNAFHHLWVKQGSNVFVAKSHLIGFNDRNEKTVAAADDIEVRLARLVLTKL